MHARFCSVDNCTELYRAFTSNGTACLFYDYDPELNISGDLYVYQENFPGEGTPVPAEGRMHNKYCVRTRWTLTGSTNPTVNGVTEHYNNLLFINSSKVTSNYRRELREVVRGGEDGTETTRFNISGTILEQYFCPEDGCEARVAEALRTADRKIVFMQFMLTSDRIGDVLVSEAETIDVEGVMSSLGVNEHSEYHRFTGSPVRVQRMSDERLVHHKVFIIDNATVITGSYNPTRAGTEENDENIVIVHDRDVAKAFMAEYGRVSEDL